MDTNKKILIVDDFATMRKLLKGMLTKLGFNEVMEAEDAIIAWDLLQQNQFDLVISDYNMPEMTGMELLEKVRADATMSDMPFILLTAETDVTLIVESKKNQVTAYVLKPFKIEIIEAKLQSVFGG